VAQEWRELRKKGLNNLFFMPDIIRVIILMMIWAGHVA